MLQDMHLLAERHILNGLKEGGWLKGEVEEMLEQRVGALFMPHGMNPNPKPSTLFMPHCTTLNLKALTLFMPHGMFHASALWLKAWTHCNPVVLAILAEPAFLASHTMLVIRQGNKGKAIYVAHVQHHIHSHSCQFAEMQSLYSH